MKFLFLLGSSLGLALSISILGQTGKPPSPGGGGPGAALPDRDPDEEEARRLCAEPIIGYCADPMHGTLKDRLPYAVH